MKIKYRSISNRINKLVEEKGLRHKDLVEKVDVSKGTVTHWLNGSTIPTGDRRTKLCELLGVTEEYLMEGSFEEENVQNSLLNFNENLLNSTSIKVLSFDAAFLAIQYINQIRTFAKNETDSTGVGMNKVEEIATKFEGKQLDVPKQIIEMLPSKPEDILAVNIHTSIFGGNKESQVNVFIDYSINEAKENGYYLIEYGELKGVRKLKVHAITGAIQIVDPSGTGLDDEVNTTEFDIPFHVAGKAVYVGIPLI